ncbi:acyl-CoA thioesterase [Mediterraneibacter catenae]|jgi:acyl-CoA thioester hydrolase|uniref:Acyl-CoA thioesterase n=1 Tax=Mediterraneibacter catenae TaxID=2594882 RepID=A0A5M9I1T6_9FIRM|nr:MULTISPECIES: thioesterase family protein [Mediterraneibacter]KAA8502997.1 acyl-CoA thioesterase [Mediterraneibacter catenae]MCF2567811.1 acyl-CoA thioesterase [Mediterraneibacter glycyrrhizinilyticus]MDN0060512.1 thioesterase family protein [Mediterraneibacter glycyrrhizinilyticus]HJA20409.1 acyl-CoA thioesterase [Candidatus Mediterraneibacter ornithocaccae]
MKPYMLKARYYETDQMGIIHHANYIRWMEEARIDMLSQMGYPYRRFEEMGYISPVLHAECEYKKSVKFDDEVKIVVSLQEFGKVKFTLRYDIYNMSEDGVLSAVGTTRHCFLNKDGRPVMMNKEMKEFSDVMQKYFEEIDEYKS